MKLLLYRGVFDVHNIPNWTVLTYNAKFSQEMSISEKHVKYGLSYIYLTVCQSPEICSKKNFTPNYWD